MECFEIREALSAALDGEPAGVPEGDLVAHLRRCPSCRAFVDRARRLPFGAPAAPADLTARVIAAARAERHDRDPRTTLLRAGLVAVASLQLILGLPGLVRGPHDTHGIHTTHEVGAWGIALAVAFLFAAARPLRAVGLLPFAAALAAGLVATAVFDLVRGHAVVLSETEHVLELVGAFLLWRLTRPGPRARVRSELHLV
jgi:predicted anti-sigma-YlaC factor YlaD